jgi:hypothetical protein
VANSEKEVVEFYENCQKKIRDIIVPDASWDFGYDDGDRDDDEKGKQGRKKFYTALEQACDTFYDINRLPLTGKGLEYAWEVLLFLTDGWKGAIEPEKANDIERVKMTEFYEECDRRLLQIARIRVEPILRGEKDGTWMWDGLRDICNKKRSWTEEWMKDYGKVFFKRTEKWLRRTIGIHRIYEAGHCSP